MRSELETIIRQALPILLLCGLFQVGAGSILGGVEESFAVPGILVMVPPLLALRGNIGGALASRLGTGLHQGVIDPGVLWGDEVKTNFFASIFLTFLVSLFIGTLGSIVTIVTGLHPFSLHLIIVLVSIALIAGMVSSFGLVGLTVLIALFSYRRDWDPDNVTSPLMASIGDFFTIISIYIGVLLVL